MATKESIITRIQKLLNLAMDPGASESERQLAQERADALRAQHMIDQMDLKPEDPNRSRVTSTVWKMALHYEFQDQVRNLLVAVVQHATCRCSTRVTYKEDPATPHHITVVGTPENIAFAERLWMIVFTELTRNMFPVWNDADSFDANVYRFVKGGSKWQEIHEVAWKHVSEANAKAGLENDPKKDPIIDPFPPAKQSQYGFRKVFGGDGGRLKRAYNRELKRLGEEVEHHTSRHSAYRTSYVSSYTSTIRRRLWDLKRHTDAEVSDKDKYALAVRSTQDQTDEEFYRLFPQFHPDKRRADQERWQQEEQERRAAMTPEERAREDARHQREAEQARKRYDALQSKSYDSSGWAKGDAVAKKVNLNNDTPIHHSRKELA